MSQWRDDDEADLHDAEFPDASDQDDASIDDDPEHLPCPFCSKPVYEEADICTHCGNFIAFSELPTHNFIWAIAGVTGVILALTAGLMYFCRW